MSSSRFRSACGVLALTLVLAACTTTVHGTGSPAAASAFPSLTATPSPTASPKQTAADLLAAAITAAEAVGTLHMTGQVTSDSQTVALDISYGATVASGTETVGGGTAALLHASDQNFYVKGDDAFYRAAGASASVIAALAGKYFRPPATDTSFGAFVRLLVLSKLLDSVSEQFTTDGALIGDTGTDQGHTVVAIVDRSDPTVQLLIDTTSHVPVELKGGASLGSLVFAGSDAPLQVDPPPASQVYGLRTGR